MIQTAASMVWAASTAYATGHFLIGTATGVPCLFQLTAGPTVNLNSNVAAYRFAVGAISGVVELTNPTSLGSATASFTTLSSLNMNGTPTAHGATQIWNNLNGAGAVTGTTQPFGSDDHDYQMVVLGSFDVPVPGQYAFNIVSHDGVLWGIGDGAQVVSGPNINPLTGPGYPQTVTPVQGYSVFEVTTTDLKLAVIRTVRSSSITSQQQVRITSRSTTRIGSIPASSSTSLVTVTSFRSALR